MYIWVVLAMFITALYGFNLHVRSDSRSLYVEPKAQSLVAKISLEHDAAREYLNDQKNKMIDNTKMGGFGIVTEGENAGQYASAIGITIGDELSDEYDGYYKLPGANNSKAKGSKVRVFCVKSNDLASNENFENSLGYECEEGEDISCCYGGAGNIEDVPQLYVVTYAPIPIRWQSRAEDGSPTGLPSRDMIKGLHKFGASGVKFGYVACNPSYDWGGENVCDGEVPSGNIRDIQTNKALGMANISEFSHFLKGSSDSTVIIPNIIMETVMDDCGDPTCIMAISTVDK